MQNIQTLTVSESLSDLEAIERGWAEEDAGEEAALAALENESGGVDDGVTAEDIPW